MRGLQATIVEHDHTVKPLYERMNQRREPAKVAMSNPKAGTEAEVVIEFNPFQAEAGADIELLIGLSRPLQNFDDLKRDSNAPRSSCTRMENS